MNANGCLRSKTIDFLLHVYFDKLALKKSNKN